MSLETLFSCYGNPSDEGRVNITGYFTRPDKLKEEHSIKLSDERAAHVIAEAQQAIADLSEYRQALAARYAQLQTAPYILRLELERRREGYREPKVFYYVRIVKVYEDGTKINELAETYKGTERRQALARFEELKKQRPGIEVWKDIEKARWER